MAVIGLVLFGILTFFSAVAAKLGFIASAVLLITAMVGYTSWDVFMIALYVFLSGVFGTIVCYILTAVCGVTVAVTNRR